MIDNYNLTDLLENYVNIDGVVTDIIQELKQNNVLIGVKVG